MIIGLKLDIEDLKGRRTGDEEYSVLLIGNKTVVENLKEAFVNAAQKIQDEKYKYQILSLEYLSKDDGNILSDLKELKPLEMVSDGIIINLDETCLSDAPFWLELLEVVKIYEDYKVPCIFYVDNRIDQKSLEYQRRWYKIANLQSIEIKNILGGLRFWSGRNSRREVFSEKAKAFVNKIAPLKQDYYSNSCEFALNRNDVCIVEHEEITRMVYCCTYFYLVWQDTRGLVSCQELMLYENCFSVEKIEIVIDQSQNAVIAISIDDSSKKTRGSVYKDGQWIKKLKNKYDFCFPLKNIIAKYIVKKQ